MKGGERKKSAAPPSSVLWMSLRVWLDGSRICTGVELLSCRRKSKDSEGSRERRDQLVPLLLASSFLPRRSFVKTRHQDRNKSPPFSLPNPKRPQFLVLGSIKARGDGGIRSREVGVRSLLEEGEEKEVQLELTSSSESQIERVQWEMKDSSEVLR